MVDVHSVRVFGSVRCSLWWPLKSLPETVYNTVTRYWYHSVVFAYLPKVSKLVSYCFEKFEGNVTEHKGCTSIIWCKNAISFRL